MKKGEFKQSPNCLEVSEEAIIANNSKDKGSGDFENCNDIDEHPDVKTQKSDEEVVCATDRKWFEPVPL